MKAGTLEIEMITNLARLQADMQQVKRAVGDMNGDVSRNLAATDRAIDGLGKSFASLKSALAGTVSFAALAAGMSAASSAALEYSRAMAEVSTLIDTTAVSMTKLQGVTMAQAQQFGTAPIAQAKALYEIMSSGASDATQATELLTVANKLAIGGVTEIAVAADGLTSVMAAYGTAAGSAMDVADSMFVAAAAGKTTIEELSKTIGNVAPLASQLGVSFDELMAAVGALTKGGIATSTSIDGLRAVLAAVAKPSDEAAKLAAQLGIQFNVAGLQAIGFNGFLQELIAKTGGSQEKLAVLFGGVEALVPVLALSGQAGKDLAANLETLASKAGTTEEAFGKMMAGPGKQLDLLFSNISVRALETATTFLDKLTPAIAFLNQNFNTIVDLLGAAGIAWATYTGVTIAAAVAQTALSGSFGVFIGFVATTTAELGALAGAQVAVAGTTGALSTAFTGLTAAMARNPFGLLAVAAAGLATTLFLTRSRTDELTGAQQANNGVSSSLARVTGAVNKELVSLATATGKAREQSLLRVQALREEAAAALQSARADMIKATALAARKAADAQAAIDSQPTGWSQAYRENTYAAQQARGAWEQQSAAANDARAKWMAARKEFEELDERITAGAKPISVAAGASEKLAKSLSNAGSAAKEAGEVFGKNFGADLINSLALYSQTISAGLLPLITELQADWEKFGNRVSEDANKGADAIQDAAEATAYWNDQLKETVRSLDQIGGKAGQLGDVAALLVGISSGDFSGSNGPLGAILKNVLTTSGEDGKRSLNDLGEILRDALDDVFGGSGSFAKTMNKVLENAGTGYAAGQLVNGAGNSGFGSMVGGALGGALGEKVLGKALEQGVSGALGKALGAAAGPLGSIVGGILGGALGGLFKKTPTGSVILNGATVVGTSGNGGRAEQAGQLGTGVVQALEKISAILGVSASGSAAVSIGMRDNLYKVDPTGRGRTKESDVLTFSDASEAVMAAVRIQIEKGAFEGLSEGVKKFLLSGDIETQLGKYADFKGALDAAKQSKDPYSYELDALNKAQSTMMQIASEVGASLDEIAQLEEYYGKQRQDIVDKYVGEDLEKQKQLASDRRDLEIQIMQLEGKSIEALAAAREIELAGVDATLQPLYQRIYALQDEAAAAAKAKAIADERYGLEGRILELQGDTAALRERELAALDPANRSLQLYIYSLQDAADAAANAAAVEQQRAQLMLSSGSMSGGGTTSSGGYAATAGSWADVEAGFAAAAAGGTNLIGGLINDIMQRDNNLAFRMKLQADRDSYLAGFDASLREQAGNEFDMQRKLSVYNEAAGAAFGAGGATPGTGPDKLTSEQLSAFLSELSVRWTRILKGGSGDENAGDSLQLSPEWHDRISAAYDRETAALRATIDQFNGFADALQDFRDSLFTPQNTFFDTSAGALNRMMGVSGRMNAGEAAAFEEWQGVASDYLDVMRRSSATELDFKEAIGLVAGLTDEGRDAALDAVDYAELQLEAANKLVDGIDGVRDAVEDVGEGVASLADEVAAMRKELGKTTGQIASNTGSSANTLSDVSRGGRSFATESAG